MRNKYNANVCQQPRSDKAIIGKFDCMSKYLIIRMLKARINECYKHFHILNEQQ